MEVRDAVESDAEALADIAGAPTDVMRNLVHDRTVRVVERDGDADVEDGGSADDVERVVGFVSFDAQGDIVHVTQFGGESGTYDRLLTEPTRFAEKERMTVEVLVDADDDSRRSAVEGAGFDYEGPGPTFEGRETVRYRLPP